MLSRRLSATVLVLLAVGIIGPLPAARVAEAQTRLFKRYERGGSYNRIIEDVLTLTIEVKPEQRTKVAVRVCSKQPLPFALVNATPDPFHIAELLVDGYAYSPSQVVFVRSEDCLGKDPSAGVTEIWTLSHGASLPPHVEERKSSDVTRTALGKRPADRGVRDYRNAVDELIKNLRADPTATGVVIGYIVRRPSPMLQRRLREVRRVLERSGLPPDRYLVRTMYWNDEGPNSEPQYPSVFIIKGAD
jgi:hypothetical protein